MTVAQFLKVREKVAVPESNWSIAQARQAMIELLAGSGLRVGALVTVRPCDCHLDGDKPRIHVDASGMACKGKIAGGIPISPYSASILAKYLREHTIEPTRPIFAFTTRAVQLVLSKVGIEGVDLHPHALRHFYCGATYYKNFEGGRADLVWVRDAAGHSNVSTTDRYLKMAKHMNFTDETWDQWANGTPVLQEATA